MKLLFELSKEHPSLPKDEIISCLNAEEIVYSIVDANENVLLIESKVNRDAIQKLAQRLSFTFYIDELLFSCSNSPNEIKIYASKHLITGDGTIAIRCKNRSENADSQQIVETLGEIYTKDRTVDLENPDIEMRVVITDTNVYVGLKISYVDRTLFEKRKVQYRPFFSPISLHPRLARALVNLSSIKKGETMLDPFCGTGGIVLEAGLVGANVIGSDVEEKMIEGCKKTLEFYEIKEHRLFCSDIGDIHKFINNYVDAVVTDLPYGKSTTTKGEDIQRLYSRAFENISKVLKKGGLAVIGLSNNEMISAGEKYFTLVDTYDFKVHRSMTRYFAVYKKI